MFGGGSNSGANDTKYKKSFIKFILLFCAFIIILFCVYLISLTNILKKQVVVSFLDIGQGDAIYIKLPNQIDILIDGGQNAKVLSKLGEVMAFWDFKIDYIILTHPHSDHVGGLNDVLQKYKVGKIYMTGVAHNSADYKNFLKSINNSPITAKQIPVEIIKENKIISLDNNEKIKLEFLYPNEDLVSIGHIDEIANKKNENLNNTSIVVKLTHNENDFLFTGDAEKEVEQKLVMSNLNLESEVLKVGHHGSKTSTTFEFLQKVNPKIAVISVGKNNKYKHPSQNVLNMLEKQNVDIIRTDIFGTIILKSNGKDIWQDKKLDFFENYAIIFENLRLWFLKFSIR